MGGGMHLEAYHVGNLLHRKGMKDTLALIAETESEVAKWFSYNSHTYFFLSLSLPSFPSAQHQRHTNTRVLLPIFALSCQFPAPSGLRATLAQYPRSNCTLPSSIIRSRFSRYQSDNTPRLLARNLVSRTQSARSHYLTVRASHS